MERVRISAGSHEKCRGDASKDARHRWYIMRHANAGDELGLMHLLHVLLLTTTCLCSDHQTSYWLLPARVTALRAVSGFEPFEIF